MCRVFYSIHVFTEVNEVGDLHVFAISLWIALWNVHVAPFLSQFRVLAEDPGSNTSRTQLIRHSSHLSAFSVQWHLMCEGPYSKTCRLFKKSCYACWDISASTGNLQPWRAEMMVKFSCVLMVHLLYICEIRAYQFLRYYRAESRPLCLILDELARWLLHQLFFIRIKAVETCTVETEDSKTPASLAFRAEPLWKT